VNIFYLDRDPLRAAEFSCDKHVVKMIVETAQILCAVAWANGIPAHYKPTHKNHPSVLWAGESRANFVWLRKHGLALAAEYTERYGKQHKSESVLEAIEPPAVLSRKRFTDPPQMMPDECKRPDTVEAYREYYRTEKAYFAKWKLGNIPAWFTATPIKTSSPKSSSPKSSSPKTSSSAPTRLNKKNK
jgi:hypothetical protein